LTKQTTNCPFILLSFHSPFGLWLKLHNSTFHHVWTWLSSLFVTYALKSHVLKHLPNCREYLNKTCANTVILKPICWVEEREKSKWRMGEESTWQQSADGEMWGVEHKFRDEVHNLGI
jgi:hypothetical protein